MQTCYWFILNISLKVAKDITTEQRRMFSILGLNNPVENSEAQDIKLEGHLNRNRHWSNTCYI